MDKNYARNGPLSKKGEDRLLYIYKHNNLEGCSGYPPHSIVLQRRQMIDSFREGDQWRTLVTQKGIDYLKQKGLI